MKKKYLFIGLIAVIIIIEIILRLCYSGRLDVAYRPAVYRPLPVVNYGYVPDTVFSILGKTHYINKHGFIGDDFSVKKEGTFRIAIVGSSSVAGSINLPAYYSFCPMLQQKFIDNNSKVQILNCGIDGNERSLELFKSIRYQVVEFEPDVVFLEYSLPFYSSDAVRENYRGYIISYPAPDMNGRAFCKEMVDKVVTYSKIVDVLYYSYIVRALVRFYYNKSNSKFKWYIGLYQSKIFVYGKFVPIQYTNEESVKMILNLKNELNEAGINFYLFQPHGNSNFFQTARENCLPLISLDVTLSENDYFPKDSHWNESGCQKVAERFYDLLIKHKLVPEEYL